MRGRQLLVVGVVELASTRVFAHPGHGLAGGSYSLGHYLTEAVHAGEGSWWWLLALAGLAGAAALMWRRRYPSR